MTSEWIQFLLMTGILTFVNVACVAMTIKLYSEFVKEAKYREPRK